MSCVNSTCRPVTRPLPPPTAIPSPREQQQAVASDASAAQRRPMHQEDTFEAASASARAAPRQHPMTAAKFVGDVKKLHSANEVYPSASTNGAHDLGQKKADFFNRALKQGASKQEAAIIVAQMMQEGKRDDVKDTQDLSKNYGLLNLNKDMLKTFAGVKDSELEALNHDEARFSPQERSKARDGIIKAALTAMRHPDMGTERYLHHVRGGATGYLTPGQRPQTNNPKVTQDDTYRFARNIKNAAKQLLADYNRDPRTLSNNTRYAGDIPWI